MLLLFFLLTKVVMAATATTGVLIVGAGVSGFGAGTRFLEQGFNEFLILEAESRIGGRIHTIPFGANVADLGAQWCEGEETNVFNISMDYLEDSRFDLDDVQFVDNTGRFYPVDVTSEIRNMLNEFPEEDALEHFAGSAGDYVAKRFQEEVKGGEMEIMIKDWFFKSRLEEEGAESLFDISAKLLGGFHTYPGSQFITWKDTGYKTLLEVLEKDLPIQDKIILGKKVVNILWDQGKIMVTCADGSIFQSDKILLTVSLGVLKEQVHTLFTPNLPKYKIKAIDAWGMGTANKFFLEFNENWWEKSNPNGFNLLWDGNETLSPQDQWLTGIFCFRPIDYQPNILLGWITTEAASHMELLTDTQVKVKVMSLLRNFLINEYPDIPDPVNFLRTKWKSNPHFRGSYSYPSSKAADLNLTANDLAQTILNAEHIPVLYFGGEATSVGSYATVHGALETGFREADKILSDLNNNRTNSGARQPSLKHWICAGFLFSIFFFRWL